MWMTLVKHIMWMKLGSIDKINHTNAIWIIQTVIIFINEYNSIHVIFFIMQSCQLHASCHFIHEVHFQAMWSFTHDIDFMKYKFFPCAIIQAINFCHEQSFIQFILLFHVYLQFLFHPRYQLLLPTLCNTFLFSLLFSPSSFPLPLHLSSFFLFLYPFTPFLSFNIP